MDSATGEELFAAALTTAVALGVAWLLWTPGATLSPKPVSNVQVVALCNEKGGTGKTTCVHHVSKTYARANPKKQILLVDGSVFGDLTSSCAGPQADLQQTFQARGTIESLSVAAKRSGGWFSPAFRAADHLVGVSGISPAAPDNLFLLSNQRGWSAWHAHRTKSIPALNEDFVAPQTDVGLAHVAAYLRNGLGQTNEEWVVFVDSDGGELHALTRFGIMLADRIVLPCRTDTASIVRLNALLTTAEALVTRAQSTAVVQCAFFNSLVVGANEGDPDSICKNFRPKSKATVASMEIIRDHLMEVSSKFPRIMQPLLALKMQSKSNDFFTAVRNGGSGFSNSEAALVDKYAASVKLAPDVAADLSTLAALMLK